MYDEDKDVVEEPADDGARHRLWVRHEARRHDLLHRTAVGARLDLGRLINYAADFVDYRWVWSVRGWIELSVCVGSSSARYCDPSHDRITCSCSKTYEKHMMFMCKNI